MFWVHGVEGAESDGLFWQAHKSAGPTDPSSDSSGKSNRIFFISLIGFLESSLFFCDILITSTILYPLKFLYEKTGKCEKYMAIKRFSDTFARRSEHTSVKR